MATRGGTDHLNLEPEVIERIRYHKQHSRRVRIAMLGPLLLALLVTLALTAYSVATGTASVERAFTASNGGFRFMWWVAPLVLVVLFLLSAARGGREDLKLYPIGEDTAQNMFKNALEGVSSAVGTQAPELVVLDLPTANSIAFVRKKKAVVGVTLEALVSDLGTVEAEAMMAHELSHIITGDVFMGSSSRQLRRGAFSLVFAVVTVVLLSSFILDFSWVVPFAIICVVPFYLYWLFRLGKLLYRQNDLLADSIAARITYNPAALRATIVKLSQLYMMSKEAFPKGMWFPDYMFIKLVRPEVTMQMLLDSEARMVSQLEPGEMEKIKKDLERNLARKSRFYQATIQDRIENLTAIEAGHWVEFEQK
jgi:Zn-dependent protease with chaperone function